MIGWKHTVIPLKEAIMRVLIALAVALLLAAATAHGAGQPLATMAGIVADMEHFPSDEEKATLAEIAGDDAADPRIRVIAEAIANIEHRPGEADREKLDEILQDPTASVAMKLVAGAVLRFEHEAAEADVQALEALAAQ
jgi:hypothetical protein